MRFEHRREPLLPRRVYVRRLARHAAIAVAIIFGSLSIGVLGYHHFAGLVWLDALLDASMILSGMGPVHVPQTAAGKLFASAYALFSGVAFITTVGVLFAPAVHRFLHKFHLDFGRESRRPTNKQNGRDGGI